MTIREFLSFYAIPIGLRLGTLWAFDRARRRPAAIPVDTNDPIWSAAIENARASLDTMRLLFELWGTEVCVKYPLLTQDDDVEHVWGTLLEISGEQVKVHLETQPIGRAKSKPPYLLSISVLEDWQLVLPDGQIRGGFTTQAQLALARKNGLPVPADIASVEDKFVDRLPPAGN